MSTCSRCGAALREGARFCLSCGEPAPPVRLSTADFLSSGVQPPSRGQSPAAGPPAGPVAASGWASPAVAPQEPRAAPPSLPQASAAWPVAALPEVSAPRYDAPPPRAEAAVAPAATPAEGDLERALARTKSYIAPAVLVCYLYALGYVPGLIVNIMYMNEARHMEQIAGERLPGAGCLATLMWAGLLVAAGVILLIWTVFGNLSRSLF